MNALRISVYLLFFSCSAAMAVDSVTNPRKKDLHIVEFLGGVHGEEVKLYIDDILIFSGKLYTKGGHVLAKSIEIESNKKSAYLNVQVSAWRPENEGTTAKAESFGMLLPGPKGHGKLIECVHIDWSKGFLVTFKINKDDKLEMQQFCEWPERK